MKGILKKNKKLIIFIVIIVLVIAIIPFYSYYRNYKANKLCGSNGKLYYCESTDDVKCDDEKIAVRAGKGYKCISKEEYRHDFLKKEYDFKCTKTYRRTFDDIDPKDYAKYGIEVNGNQIVIKDHNEMSKDLIEKEKECLHRKMSSEVNKMLADFKEKVPSQFDIRSKVTVKAGNQGSSDTCVLWVLTKALEISAQLKNIDYQFLLDFEKEINNTTYSPSGVADENGNIHFGLEYLIPGNKKTVSLQDFRHYYVNPDANVTYYPEYSKSLLNNYKAYEELVGTDNCVKYSENAGYCEYPFEDEYNILNSYYIKKLVTNYGSAFIQTDSESKKFASGHMMLIIGWDDTKESWLVLNSWGDTWQDAELIPNGDGTTWIKYSNKDYVLYNDMYGNAIELIGK